jgi:mycothione reductase
MEKFDVIVIGSGSGMVVVSRALEEGLKVALVEKGPLGGTCLNNGCIPSKVLIYPADVISTLKDAKNVGVDGAVNKADFSFIMKRAWDIIHKERKGMEEGIKSRNDLTWYKETGEFVGDYKLKVGDETIMAPKIVIASGARPSIPPVEGLKESGFIDNVSLLDLKGLPASVAIIGAGYIGCEFGHFFSALGSEVTLIGRHPTVLKDEDPEISAIVTKVLSRDLRFLANHSATKVEKQGDKKIVYAKDRKTGKAVRVEADEVMVATGRKSNSDLLKPENTGVETDKRGWVNVNKYMETSKPGIYALGDATDRYMFKHTANYEAEIVADNMLRGNKRENDTHAVPHAVFTHPQVGGVGMTEAQAMDAGLKVLVGRARYADTAKGYAMADEDGLVKVVVEEGTDRILGCQIAGPDASILIQEVVFLMNTVGQDLSTLWRSQIVHPATSEVIANAFASLERPKVEVEAQAR